MSDALQDIPYGGWSRCYRLANPSLELIVTGEVGPRVIRLARPGGPNLFHEVPEHLGQTGGETWRSYGGHRFWHAPEAKPRSYQPDNEPLEVTALEGGLRLVQPTEPATGLQKALELTLGTDASRVSVRHELTNCGLWPIRVAPWALSVMRPGGTALIPLPPRGTHPEALLPSSTLTLWPYSDPSDPRFVWGQRFLRVRQDPSARTPQKIGASVPDGWCAYIHAHGTFVKTFEHQPGASYPDLGSSVEVFTNRDMLELETLGPLQVLEPGERVGHTERWHVGEGASPQPDGDEALDALLLPLVAAARSAGE